MFRRVVLVGLAAMGGAGMAAPVVFTIDSTNSVITESGQIGFLGFTFPFAEQAPGSLTTHYSGTMLVDLTPPTLQFPGGSTIAALTNGNWQPADGGGAGSAPADLAGKINISLGFFGGGTGYSAGRNLKLDLASAPVTLTNSHLENPQFTLSYITNSPPDPTVDFRLTGSGLVTSTNGSIRLSGMFTNTTAGAYLTNTAGRLKLVIPVNVTNLASLMSAGDTTMILQGQIVATAPSGAWPFPLTINTGGGQITLTWPSVAGQNFVVKTSPNLLDWSEVSSPAVVHGNLTSWNASLTNAAQFYQVQLQ